MDNAQSKNQNAQSKIQNGGMKNLKLLVREYQTLKVSAMTASLRNCIVICIL